MNVSVFLPFGSQQDSLRIPLKAPISVGEIVKLTFPSFLTRSESVTFVRTEFFYTTAELLTPAELPGPSRYLRRPDENVIE